MDLDIGEKQYAIALERIQRIINENSSLALPWAIRAKIQFAQRDVTQAELDLLKAIELDPKLEGAYVLLAQLYTSTGRSEQAVEKLSRFVEQKKSIPTLMQLGVIQLSLKQYSAARDSFEKLLTLNPDFAPALNNLAVLYSDHLGQLDTAYNFARKAKDLLPNEPATADTLGWVLLLKGEYENALKLLLESSSKLPERLEIQYHLGMAHYMLGEDAPARIALERAAASKDEFPGKEDARQRLTVLAINAASANQGERNQLEAYLREKPNDPTALFRLAEIQERDGATDQAVKTYEKIFSGYPSYAPANRRLAILYGQRSADDPKVFEVTTKAREAYPNDPDIAKTLGVLNYRRGYYLQSAELLRSAVTKRQDDAELLYYLGKSYQQIKRWPECNEALELALKMNLAATLKDDARTALAECSETSPL